MNRDQIMGLSSILKFARGLGPSNSRLCIVESQIIRCSWRGISCDASVLYVIAGALASGQNFCI